MPHHKSSKKRLRTSKIRNLRNRTNRAETRSALKSFRKQAATASAEDNALNLPKLYSMLDIQAQKGVIPRKRAARLKSRLAALVQG